MKYFVRRVEATGAVQPRSKRDRPTGGVQFASAEIVALQLTPQGFARLVAAISASHELDAAGRPIPLGPGPGLYGRSRFYASSEAFHLFATCNVWVAGILREAGVPVSPMLSQTSGALFTQLRRHGQVIRPLP